LIPLEPGTSGRWSCRPGWWWWWARKGRACGPWCASGATSSSGFPCGATSAPSTSRWRGPSASSRSSAAGSWRRRRKAPVHRPGAAHRLGAKGGDGAMARLGRQVAGLVTILWVAALIVLSYSPGFLTAAPEPWSAPRLEALDEALARREVHLWVEGSDQTWRLTGADVALRVDWVATRALAAAPPRPESPDLPVVTLEAWRIRSWLRERVAGSVRVDPVPARLDAQGRVIP